MTSCTTHWRRNRGGARRGGCPPPPLFRVGGGGGAKICLCPHFQTQNLGLGIEPTDICDVTLARLASRCWARQMCPPPILSRSYAVATTIVCVRGTRKNKLVLSTISPVNTSTVFSRCIFDIEGSFRSVADPEGGGGRGFNPPPPQSLFFFFFLLVSI